MPFPTVQATNSSNEAADTNSHTVALPAGIQADELLIVFFACHEDSISAFPGDWTKFFDRENANEDFHLSAGYRKADGLEGASMTITTAWGQSAHMSYRISGMEDPGVTPPEISAGALGITGDPNPDGLTPGGGSREYLWLACGANRHGNDYFSSYPTNYTNGMRKESNTGAGSTAMGSARRFLVAASENPGTFHTLAVEHWIAMTLAVYGLLGKPPGASTAGKLIAAGVI